MALIIFIVDFSRGWLNSGGIIAFIAAELVIIFSLSIVLCVVSECVCGDNAFVCVAAYFSPFR